MTASKRRLGDSGIQRAPATRLSCTYSTESTETIVLDSAQATLPGKNKLKAALVTLYD